MPMYGQLQWQTLRCLTTGIGDVANASTMCSDCPENLASSQAPLRDVLSDFLAVHSQKSYFNLLNSLDVCVAVSAI